MASNIVAPWQSLLVVKNPRLKKHHSYFHTKKTSYSVIRNEKTSTFNYRSTANIPIYELPGASFDQYMDDKLRVARAVFHDKTKTKQLNEEEWRIKMAPMQVLFMNVQPSADVKLTIKSNGEDYPPHIPHHISKILEVHFIKWELKGLNTLDHNDPYHLSLDVKGTIYPERSGKHSWLKNQIEMKISFILSPAMGFIPEDVLQNTFEMVFKTMSNEMKQDFNGRLLADYNSFKRYKSKKNSV
ncbi:hypothetical protein QL285_030764 [Trifolium repens]|nr:hypothetical protein QL285_030764 [Trifolium repens]